MKKSLGRIFLFLLLFISYAHAKDLATYKLFANKITAYQKEAVVITFEAIQKDKRDNMMFLLEPNKSSDYEIILLNKKIDDKKYHSSHTLFTYLLFPLTDKNEIAVEFDFTIQTASDKAIAHSYVDDHDDSIAIQTYNTKMKVKPLYIRVKKLQKAVDLVGDFTLKEKIQKSSINQYESANIIYTLSGTGYEGKNIRPIKDIPHVTIFSETNDLYAKATRKGFSIKREYIYALSAKQDFTIPAVKLEVFSPKSKKYYTLSTPQHPIKVQKIDTTKLLDNEEYPVNKSVIDFSEVKQFLIYLLIFITGYTTAKLQSFSRPKRAVSKELLEIKKTQNAKELLFSLINTHLQNQFPHEVQILEDMVYNNAQHNFSAIKNKIIKELK